MYSLRNIKELEQLIDVKFVEEFKSKNWYDIHFTVEVQNDRSYESTMDTIGKLDKVLDDFFNNKETHMTKITPFVMQFKKSHPLKGMIYHVMTTTSINCNGYHLQMMYHDLNQWLKMNKLSVIRSKIEISKNNTISENILNEINLYNESHVSIKLDGFDTEFEKMYFIEYLKETLKHIHFSSNILKNDSITLTCRGKYETEKPLIEYINDVLELYPNVKVGRVHSEIAIMDDNIQLDNDWM